MQMLDQISLELNAYFIVCEMTLFNICFFTEGELDEKDEEKTSGKV